MNVVSNYFYCARADGHLIHDLVNVEITRPPSPDETPASAMPELNFFGYESDEIDDTIVVGGG